jgi:hypothetical protein
LTASPDLNIFCGMLGIRQVLLLVVVVCGAADGTCRR